MGLSCAAWTLELWCAGSVVTVHRLNFSAAFGKMTTLLLKHGLSLASGISPGFSWVLLGFPLIISLLVSPYPLGPFWWIPVVLVF